MIIGVVRIELFLPVPNSLKAKRFVLKSLTDRIRRKFNVSVSELDANDLWQRAVLGIAAIGSEKRFLNSVLDNVIDVVEAESDVQVTKCEMEFI